MNDLLFCLLAAITVAVTVAHVAEDMRSGYAITPMYFIAYAVALCEMIYIMAYAAYYNLHRVVDCNDCFFYSDCYWAYVCVTDTTDAA